MGDGALPHGPSDRACPRLYPPNTGPKRDDTTSFRRRNLSSSLNLILLTMGEARRLQEPQAME
jgi:hypothetical protein